MKRKVNSRKADCEVCGVSTGSQHKRVCEWAYLPRPTAKAGKRFTLKEKMKVIYQIIKQ